MNITESSFAASATMPQKLIGHATSDHALIASMLNVDDAALKDIKKAISDQAEHFIGSGIDCEWELFITGADDGLFWMRPCLDEDSYDCYQDDDCHGVRMDTYQLGFMASLIGLNAYGVKLASNHLKTQALLLGEYAQQIIGELANEYVKRNPDYLEDTHEEPESLALAMSFMMDLNDWFFKYKEGIQ